MEADLAINLEERVNGNGRRGALVNEPAPEPEALGSEPETVGRLAAIVESMLLASGAPVPLARLVEALDGPERREVTAARRALGQTAARGGRGRPPGGRGWGWCTSPAAPSFGRRRSTGTGCAGCSEAGRRGSRGRCWRRSPSSPIASRAPGPRSRRSGASMLTPC